ncbi:type I-C CRISPR-associated protein Cas5c [Teredinibacter turnerae]|uniref:type I-C CRISPR-associated protein Cas5c n=1 Tax=Teredinibacter turnerae TaxID=2426 RepID=UPI0003792346|nr:type I-C CRISPR-associated protein Cas5c [Teredinibacter turnerae]
MEKNNSISFRLWGRYALFTDPVTKLGGEKLSYHLPTYEAIKGVLKSIYWKPTLIWHVDRVRVLKQFRTEAKSMKPLDWGGGNTLSIYTYLRDVEYQVEAHFEWNLHRPALEKDRIDGKHFSIAKRMLERGGRQDIFLGVRDCQAYVEPCEFGAGPGCFDELEQLDFGLMFHGFDYPDESGEPALYKRFWRPVMRHGVVEFPRPEVCEHREYVRPMSAKAFAEGNNLKGVVAEEALL